ncbi:MAG: hypothetical protein ACU0CA_11780 [Paracoccaceae bacterium]
MSDLERLGDKLSKLGATTAPSGKYGREIEVTQSAGFLRAVLLEIDETILARALNFRNETGAGLTLEVANRRLHSVVEITLEDLTKAKELIGQQFSEQGNTLVASLADLLNDFFESSKQIFVYPTRLTDSHDPQNIGCAAEVLATNWSLSLYENASAETDGTASEFVEFCTEISVASVQFNTAGTEKTTGDPQEIKRLKELANHDTSGFDTQLAKTFGDTSRCIVVGAGGLENNSIIYVGDSTEGAYLTIPTERISKIQAHWQKLQS